MEEQSWSGSRRPDGHTAWAAVANALGCTVERAKIDFGPIKKAAPDEILDRPMMRRR